MPESSIIFKNKGPRMNPVSPCVSDKTVFAPSRHPRPFAFKGGANS